MTCSQLQAAGRDHDLDASISELGNTLFKSSVMPPLAVTPSKKLLIVGPEGTGRWLIVVGANSSIRLKLRILHIGNISYQARSS